MQRRRGTLKIAAMTALHTDGRRRPPKFIYFFKIFYSTASREKKRARKGKRRKIRNLFPGSIGWDNKSSFLPTPFDSTNTNTLWK
jgi:hypothetical protein